MKNLTNGEILKRERVQHGVTQLQLANLIGLNRNTVRRWETGESRFLDYELFGVLAYLPTSEQENEKS